jgi:hypothetical protein
MQHTVRVRVRDEPQGRGRRRGACWYPKGVKITDIELASIPLDPHDFHGEWNYTINAQSDPA